MGYASHSEQTSTTRRHRHGSRFRCSHEWYELRHLCIARIAGIDGRRTACAVRDGDMIELNVERRELNLLIDDATWSQRKELWKPAKTRWPRGYYKLFADHVTQAHQGCDFDFLEGPSEQDEPDIF